VRRNDVINLRSVRGIDRLLARRKPLPARRPILISGASFVLVSLANATPGRPLPIAVKPFPSAA
jgi:hypothetical protein